MSTTGLVVSLIIVGMVVLWVALPLLRRAAPNTESLVERHRERLQVYYARVLRNLHDLDEDYATGKLHEDEYRVEREEWVQRGVQALKALDELDAEHLTAPQAADNAAIDEAIDRTIEEAIVRDA
ncbi:MAG: hypothetical protein OHK0046_32500 [Anaerolineae bacterium]